MTKIIIASIILLLLLLVMGTLIVYFFVKFGTIAYFKAKQFIEKEKTKGV